MHRVLTLSIALIVAASPAFADGPADAGLSNDVAQLEMRFFEHTYPGESLDDRLSRLEKLVFGEVKEGSQEERMTGLLTAIPASEVSAASQSALEQSGPDSTGQTASYDGASSTEQDVEADSGQYSDYPHVTALEKELLGHTYVNLSLSQRLNQLESKVFGAPSTKPDLSSRVDRLEQFADAHLHKRPFGINPDMADDASDGGYAPAAIAYSPQPVDRSPDPDPQSPAPHQGSLLSKVSWMELRLFGHTFKTEHLMDRLRRIDVAMFPSEPPPPGMKLMDQIDTLMGAVEHLYPATRQQAYEDTSAGAPASDDTARASDQATAVSSASSHPRLRSLAQMLGTIGNISLGSGAGGMAPGIWF